MWSHSRNENGYYYILLKNVSSAAKSVGLISFTRNCSSSFGRAAGDSIEFVIEVIFESTEPDALISLEEIIDTIAQNENTASIATDISNETGNEVSVRDVRLIENPSTSLSLSPAPTHSLKPTLSNSPSNKLFPSSSPTYLNLYSNRNSNRGRRRNN